MSVICVSSAAPPGPLDAPTNFVHEQIVDDPDETYLSWTAVAGADVYNVRRESDNSILSLQITGSAGAGAYAGKLVYRLGSGTGGESPLTAATLYRVYMTAMLTGGSRESAPSAVDGAMTANAPVGGSLWATNTPTFVPMLPWTAGPGSDTYGGSGRDAPSGGSGATTTIYFVGTLAELRTALNATGRRYIIFYKSGVYNLGFGAQTADGELEIRNDGLLTFIDLSPAPGAIVQAGCVTIWSNSGAGATTRGKDMAFINIRIFAKDRTYGTAIGSCVNLVSSTGTYERLWFAYGASYYAFDQNMTFTYRSDNCGMFGWFCAKAINLSGHDESPHSTGTITEWVGNTTGFGTIRCLHSDNSDRNILSGAQEMVYADNVTHNFAGGLGLGQANDQFTVGYPTQNQVDGNVFVRGANDTGNAPVTIGIFGSPLHAGSRVSMRSNRGIGYTDTNQSDLCSNPQAITIESGVLPNAPVKGYVYNPVGTSLAEKQARVALVCATCGPWISSRDSATQGIINGVTASATTAGSGGDIIDAGEENYPTLAVNTADFTSGGDPAPGISAMTTGGFALGSAGRVLSANSAGQIYTAFEHWIHRRLLSVCGIGP